jgi:hypothetical protein
MKKFWILIFCLILLPVFVFAQGCVDINTGTLAQLDELTGIGPAKAQAIIDARPYSSIDDLDRAVGIGPTTVQNIKDQGLASINCAAQNPNTQNPTPNQTPPAESPVGQSSGQESQNRTPVTYPNGVYINEILPNPEGPDETEEWIELYNSNSFDIDLSGWQLQDRAGTITTYTIPSVTKIMAGGYLIFKRPETKIMLNNDGDGINLLTPDKKIIDSVGFTSSPLGQTYNLILGDWKWSTTMTPGSANKVSSVTKTLPKEQKSDNNGNIKAENLTADFSNTIPAQTNPWPLFLIVLTSTIFLAIVVLIIKFKLT